MFENVEQNSNYLRLNAQRELRKCEEFGERPEEPVHVLFTATGEVKELLDRAQQLMFSGVPVAVENVIRSTVRLQRGLEIDHGEPLGRGGSWAESNLRT